MSDRADIAVFSPDKKLKLVVEVKGNRGVSREWASQFRRNLLAHNVIPRSPFFLLALPDKFYLWKNGSDSSEAGQADFEEDSSPIVRAYTKESNGSVLGNTSLGLIFSSWLNLLTISDLTEEKAEPHEQWLFQSGLYDAIKNGSVETDASSHECLY